MTKTPPTNSLQNSNHSHLPNKETKLSKQKEPVNIKKSLLSRPIVVSKTIAKTESRVSARPCKPANKYDKVNTKSHPLQLSKIPNHSTPVKEQAVSSAVSPKQDMSEANDDKMIPTKQRRRSGIPLLGSMVRILMVQFSFSNNATA